MTAFLSWLGQAVVVGIGWYVVDRLSARRDSEKARREAIVDSVDAIALSATEILTNAREYHSKDRVIALETRIKMDLQDLSMKLGSLTDIYKDASSIAHCRSQILALRKAITGRHFEDEHTSPLADGDIQHEEIAAAMLDLKRGLLKIRHRQFAIND